MSNERESKRRRRRRRTHATFALFRRRRRRDAGESEKETRRCTSLPRGLPTTIRILAGSLPDRNVTKKWEQGAKTKMK